MVVCVCNAIRERELREAARPGAVSAGLENYIQLNSKPEEGDS